MHVEEHLRAVLLEHAAAGGLQPAAIRDASRDTWGPIAGLPDSGPISRFRKGEKGYKRPTPRLVAAYSAALRIPEHELWAEAVERFAAQAAEPNATDYRRLELESDARDHGHRRARPAG